MGSACSHYRFEIFNIDPNTYNEKEKTWRFKVADAECVDCKMKLRAIKKTCIDHNIPQPWELIDHHICKHDMIIVRHKRKNEKHMIYTGRSECVGCLISIPIYCPYKILTINGNPTEVRNVEWEVNEEALAKEMKNRKENTIKH